MDFDPSKPSTTPVSESISSTPPASDQKSPAGAVGGHEVQESAPNIKLSEHLSEKLEVVSLGRRKLSTLQKDDSYLLSVATDGVRAGSVLHVMVEEKKISAAPDLLGKVISVIKKMPKDDPGILEWASQSTSYASAALYASVVMMKSPNPSLRKSGWYAVMCATTNQEEHCVALVNVWIALECLNGMTSLTARDQEYIPRLFALARDHNLPAGRWMHGLYDLGLIQKLPSGDPVAGIDSLLQLRTGFQPLPEETEPVGYQDDPVVFGFLDKLPRVRARVDLSFLEDLSLTDPRCFYDLMPVIVAANLQLPSSPLLLEQLETLPEKVPLPVRQLIRDTGFSLHLLLQLRNKHVLQQGVQLTLAEKKAPEQVADIVQDFFSGPESRGEGYGALAQYVDLPSRKRAVQLKENLEILLKSESAPCPELKALLLVQLGKLYEVQLIKSEKPLAKACDYYREACELMPSASFVKHIEDLLVRAPDHRQAAAFLKAMKPVLDDDSYTDLKIKQYEQTAEVFEHWSGKVDQAEIDKIFHELKLVAEPERKSRKKRKKKAQKDTEKDLLAPDSGVSDKDTSISSKSETVTETSDTKEPVLPETPKPIHDKLLTRHWHSNVFKVLNVALYYRYVPENYEKEKQTLVKGVETIAGEPGVERLHEELAWHYIRKQRDTMKLTSENKGDPKKLRKASKQLLDKAEHHLFIALGRKLGVSADDAVKLYTSNEWEAVADEIHASFSSDTDRRCYSNGIECMMSSLGHIASERSQHLSTGPTLKSTAQARKGYSGKTFKS